MDNLFTQEEENLLSYIDAGDEIIEKRLKMISESYKKMGGNTEGKYFQEVAENYKKN